MRYRNLGRSGLKVSEIALGCARFGEISDDAAERLVACAIDCGISTFDTADAYNGGRSEEALGRAIRSRRDKVVVCTKVGLRVGDTEPGHTATMLGTLDLSRRWSEGIGTQEQGLSRAHIRNAIDGSLRRLGTEYVDVYQVHRFDPDVPLEETLSVLDDLVRMGKVRYIGCSAFAAWQLFRALWVSDVRSLEAFTSIQLPYNMAARDAERELLPAVRAGGVGGLAFQVLAGGLFSGRYQMTDQPDPTSRMGSRAIYRSRYWNEASFAAVERLRTVAHAQERTLSSMAVAWVLARTEVASVLFGASSADQLADAIDASERPLDPSSISSIDAALTG